APEPADRLFGHPFAGLARDERAGTNPELEPGERGPARDVGGRLARQAAGQEPVEPTEPLPRERLVGFPVRTDDPFEQLLRVVPLLAGVRMLDGVGRFQGGLGAIENLANAGHAVHDTDMDFRDTPEEAAFRSKLRGWLAANLPDGWGATEWREPEGEARVAFYKDWSRKLYEAGYIGLHWPKAYGGGEAPITLSAIVLEELARSEAPEHIGLIGIGMAGPTIMAHGTDEQRDRFLANILSGEEVWCQGFSEPEAGSDRASLQTKAVPYGDGFRVTGQKEWSSFAHIADWCILV